MKLIILACCLFGVSLGESEIIYQVPLPSIFKDAANNFETLSAYEKVETINDICDVALLELGFLLKDLKLDPLNLPDVNQTFDVGKDKGSIEMNNGFLRDVSNVVRDGNVTLTYINQVLAIDLPILMPEFSFSYDFDLKVGILKPKGSVTGGLESVPLHLSLEIDFGNMVITLKKFDVPEIKAIKVKFEGLGALQWLANILSAILAGSFKGIIRDVLVNVVGGALESLIKMVNELLAGLN